MRIKQNVTVYYCDHCKKKMFRKHAMEYHEKWCASNPDNYKACTYCKHLEETKVTIYGEHAYDGSEYSFERKGFKCAKLDKLVYPLSVQRRGLDTRFETFYDQEPMPKVCEHQSTTPQWEF